MRNIDSYLHSLLERKGSDLHFAADQPIRIRLNGRLEAIDETSYSPDDVEEAMQAICPPDRWEHFKQTHDLDFAYEIPEVARFRTNFFVNTNGPGAVLRHIPSRVTTLKELGMPKVMTDLCHIRSGLILITGATGSGKTTTLTYMIDQINSSRRCKIIMIEDPIEYVHDHKMALVVQQELYTDVPNFNAGLLHILRQDPDVIGIGEMRNFDTIGTALTAAETGHLVIATLHTSSVVTTVERIVGVFPPEQQPAGMVGRRHRLPAYNDQAVGRECRRADQQHPEGGQDQQPFFLFVHHCVKILRTFSP